ncbi:aminotransferase class I/II-fold pyridoxal phosphate-dependent enzyme [Patescibacteria group bacterium]
MTDWRQLVAQRCGGTDFDKPGGGYAFSAILEEERELEKSNIPGQSKTALLKLSVADPTWKMNRQAIEAAVEYYDLCPDATRYTDLAGIRANNGTGLGDTHAEIVSNVLKGNRSLLSEKILDKIQYSPGSIKRALAEYIPTTFFDAKRGDLLIFPVPGYPVIKSSMNNQGINVRDVPMVFTKNGWRIPLDKIPTGGKQNIFIYFNNPHNPTGSAYTLDELTQLVGWASANNVTIIADEAYISLVYNGSAASITMVPNWENCCIVLQSISKGWSATGIRFGWIMANPIAIKALRKVMDVKDSGMSGPMIAAAISCLRDSRQAKKTNMRYLALHKILAQGLKESGFGGQIPDAGLCQFTRAPRSVNGHEFSSLIDCVQWFRKDLRISLMHYEVEREWYLRWAVTLKPVPKCGLPTEESVLEEVVRRLQKVNFTF